VSRSDRAEFAQFEVPLAVDREVDMEAVEPAGPTDWKKKP
jgi:hypothetical protein